MLRPLTATLLCLGPLAFAQRAAAAELRGLWVVRTALVSPESVDGVVDQAAAAGFNALFVQVRGRGDAFYQSKLAARSPLIPAQQRDFDPLARLLERSRGRKLQVHAWVNVLLTAHFGQPLPRDHVLARHPDWVMVPRAAAAAALRARGGERLPLVMAAARSEPDTEGFYITPAEPEVGAHLEAVVRELVRSYELDGLHLDFVRYPGPDYDYSRVALEGFKRRMGGADLLSTPGRFPSQWADYRRELLTAVTARLADAARSERPGLVVSAAVAPDEAQAVHHKFQDWPAWLESRILSAVCPMVYTPDNRLFQQLLGDARRRVQGQTLWAGIGAYRLDAAGLVEKIALARQAGANGVVLFSHESLDAARLRRLREEAFVREAAAAQGAGAAPVTTAR